MGLKSSSYAVSLTAKTTNIPIDTDILTSDIEVTAESLGGSSGLFRVYFSLTTGADYNLAVIRTSTVAGGGVGGELVLNGDNGFLLKNGAYYRFDINVRPGDAINFQTVDESGTTSPNITAVREFRIDQIQIGA